MIGIIFATKIEAAPFLKSVQASVECKKPFLSFKVPKHNMSKPCTIIISGIGKVVAAAATVELILKYGAKLIINVGICGALKNYFYSDTGKIYKISCAIEGDRILNSKNYIKPFKGSSFFNSLEEAALVTCDKAIFDDDLKQYFSKIADLVDMEGTAVIRIANKYNVKCDIIKGASDIANTGGIKLMMSNIDKMSFSLSKLIQKNLRF